MSEKEIYVVVVERDHKDPLCSHGAIVWETYTNRASLEEARQLVKTRGGDLGRTRIAKLEFIEDWQG